MLLRMGSEQRRTTRRPGTKVTAGEMGSPWWSDDPVLAALVQEGREDPEVVGLLLGGSRGAGCADERSDYDFTIVLTDAAHDVRRAAGESMHLRARKVDPRDRSYTCVRELEVVAATPGWWTPGYVTTRVLLDKTGAVAATLQRIVDLPPEQAREAVAAGFDGYLNGFYRSLKAWRRDNEVGARLEAAESMMFLIRTLFSLAGRWPPYHDRLIGQLHHLEGQGWTAETLQQSILTILATADPTAQQQLEAKVEALLREHGFGRVVDGWEEDIPEVKSWRFAK
jgi:hypothetical protein